MQRYMRGIKGFGIQQDSPISVEVLEKYVPSIFAEVAHSSRSERFKPVRTFDVVERLQGEGYFPFYAIQTASREEEKRNTTKHMLRFRRNEFDAKGEVDEIILVNANDGTSAYNLISGQFRFVCANGLICGRDMKQTKVYHKGNNIIDDVIEGVYTVVDEFAENHRLSNEMKMIGLDDKTRLGMAMAGYMLKEGQPEDFNNLKYDPKQLLIPHNAEDKNNGGTLFNTFNIIQENLMRGGQRGYNRITQRNTSTRAVSNIDRNVDLNVNLWNLAVNMVAAVAPNKVIKDVHDYV